jgi:hypothetical protein
MLIHRLTGERIPTKLTIGDDRRNMSETAGQ